MPLPPLLAVAVQSRIELSAGNEARVANSELLGYRLNNNVGAVSCCRDSGVAALVMRLLRLAVSTVMVFSTGKIVSTR